MCTYVFVFVGRPSARAAKQTPNPHSHFRLGSTTPSRGLMRAYKTTEAWPQVFRVQQTSSTTTYASRRPAQMPSPTPNNKTNCGHKTKIRVTTSDSSAISQAKARHKHQRLQKHGHKNSECSKAKRNGRRERKEKRGSWKTPLAE